MSIHIEGLDELIQRMDRYPAKLRKSLRTTVTYALHALLEAVPGYPSPPADSEYIRTGTLGRSLTANGPENIFEVQENGGYVEGSFGTNLEYAPYVIGDPDTQQAGHMRHWWTLPVTVLNRAMSKIEQGFQVLADELAEFLAGKGD